MKTGSQDIKNKSIKINKRKKQTKTNKKPNKETKLKHIKNEQRNKQKSKLKLIKNKKTNKKHPELISAFHQNSSGRKLTKYISDKIYTESIDEINA